MNWSIFLLLFGLFVFILLIFQRIDPKKRRIASLPLIPALIFTYNYINYRNAGGEALLALVLALIVSFVFWLMIGRYNRVKSADETIKVLGMDD
ncbi:MAG: hypothetical protein KC547_15985 [Anaerolineae bacterium]|nr:hypothetical protein [Anaerolineae bacterium]